MPSRSRVRKRHGCISSRPWRYTVSWAIKVKWHSASWISLGCTQVTGNLDEAIPCRRSSRFVQAASETVGQFDALLFLGQVAQSAWNLPEAERYFTLSGQACHEFGSPYSRRGVSYGLDFALLQGRYDEAEELLRDCRQMAHQCGALERDLEPCCCG